MKNSVAKILSLRKWRHNYYSELALNLKWESYWKYNSERKRNEEKRFQFDSCNFLLKKQTNNRPQSTANITLVVNFKANMRKENIYFSISISFFFGCYYEFDKKFCWIFIWVHSVAIGSETMLLRDAITESDFYFQRHHCRANIFVIFEFQIVEINRFSTYRSNYRTLSCLK